MKKYIYSALLIGLCAASQVFAAKVTNVRLSYENGATVARVDVQGPIRFAHQTEIPKDGKPDRMILDVIGATNELSVREYLSLPTCPVKGIRTSQYSVKPEKIVRVVFDMTKAPIYQVTQDGASIRIAFTDNTAKPFSNWSATTVAAPAKTEPVKTPVTTQPTLASTPTATNPTSTPAQQNKVAEQDRQASLSPKSTAPTATPTPSAQPKVETKPQAVTTPSVTPTTAPTPTAAPAKTEVKPTATAAKPEVKTAPVATQTPPAKQAPATVTPPSKPTANAVPPETAAKTAPVATTDTKPKVVTPVTPPAVQAKPSDKAPAPTAQTAVPTGTTSSSSIATKVEPVMPPAVKPATAPTASTNAPVTTTPPQTKPEAVKPSTPVATTPAKAETPVASHAEASTSTVAPIPLAPKGQPTIPAPIAETSDEDTSQEADQAILSEEAAQEVDSTDIKSTARFRRNPAAQAKIKGTMVAEFPKRLLVKYEGDLYRDPFAPLIDNSRTNNNPFAARIPNIEGLKLVGIIESSTGDNRALLEDKNNYSYMLKSGDKVQKGYVLRVEDDKIYFQIFEYGWSRTVALTMYENEGR